MDVARGGAKRPNYRRSHRPPPTSGYLSWSVLNRRARPCRKFGNPAPPRMLDAHAITGLVLAGGRGARMGGIDKGLQLFQGVPLALHALRRLQGQTVASMLNANRNLEIYRSFGVPVWADGIDDYPGPLGGVLVGMEHCPSRWLLTVPCDCPLFPPDLALRLLAAAQLQGADIALAAAPQADETGHVALRKQPIFCLMRTALRPSLQAFMDSGGRKIGAWAAQHHCAIVPFDLPGDDPRAFFNANTMSQLQALESAVLGDQPL